MKKVSARDRLDLLKAARAAARHSYSPYSRFRVGAAVLTRKGAYTGVNVENASYGLALCAERTALARAVTAEGKPEIRAIAVACVDAARDGGAGALMPCGACRQWISELAPNAEILVDGIRTVYRIEQLLGAPFTLKRRTGARQMRPAV